MSLSVDAFPACFQYTSMVRTELASKHLAGYQHFMRLKQKRFFVIRDGVSERENGTTMSNATRIESATLLSCETHTKILQELLDALPHCIWIARPEGFMEYANCHWRNYTTMTIEQAQGHAWLQCVHPDDRQRTLDALQTAIQTGAPYEMEHRMRNGTTGAYQWFLVRGEPYKDGRGTILKWFGTCTNIDDHKDVEQRRDAFLNMASYELKTPLAALRMQLQLVRKRLEQRGLHEAVADLARIETPMRQLECLIGLSASIGLSLCIRGLCPDSG